MDNSASEHVRRTDEQACHRNQAKKKWLAIISTLHYLQKANCKIFIMSYDFVTEQATTEKEMPF